MVPQPTEGSEGKPERHGQHPPLLAGHGDEKPEGLPGESKHTCPAPPRLPLVLREPDGCDTRECDADLLKHLLPPVPLR